MANKSAALASVLTTVSKTANTVGSVMDTVTDTIGMANAFVTKASQEQQDRYKVERVTFRANLINEAKSLKADADKEIAVKRNDKEWATFFDNAGELYDNLFDD